MKPIKHSTSTHMQGTLPITKTEAEGQAAIVTFWKPTPEDLMQLNTGGVISLLVIGETMPTVAVAAIKA
jgi:hypothetical protein